MLRNRNRWSLRTDGSTAGTQYQHLNIICGYMCRLDKGGSDACDLSPSKRALPAGFRDGTLLHITHTCCHGLGSYRRPLPFPPAQQAALRCCLLCHAGAHRSDVAELKLTDMAMRLDAPDTARASPASCPHPDVGVLRDCKILLHSWTLEAKCWMLKDRWCLQYGKTPEAGSGLRPAIQPLRTASETSERA